MSNHPTVRRSQLLSTYGVGGLFPAENTSYMIMGLDRWSPGDVDAVSEPRLARSLGVSRLYLPPAGQRKGDIPARRFPQTQFCPGCYRIGDIFKTFNCGYDESVCRLCKDERDLIPFRLMVCCKQGHVDEFPYYRWLHLDESFETDGEHKMSIKAAGNSSSLADMQLSCSCGVPSIGLDGAFTPGALSELKVKCRGRRPWLGDTHDDCSAQPRTVQRGASNVWFPTVRSAISIPPYSMAVAKFVDTHSRAAAEVFDRPWSDILADPDESDLRRAIRYLANKAVKLKRSFTAEGIEAEVNRQKNSEEDTDTSDLRLRRDEFAALMDGSSEDFGSEFAAVPRQVPAEFDGLISAVRKVTRLKEVRALYGFSRLNAIDGPPGTEGLCALSQHNPDWLPAIEVSGEGVFAAFDPGILDQWSREAWVRGRGEKINEALHASARSYGRPPPPVVSVSHIALHTFAHMLIDQFSLDSGYPASSLRERLYVDESMAGVFIYTASSDSAGSLGGVAAQAEPVRMEHALREAIQRLSWCSSDPVCIESRGSGTDSLNLAACHACVLVPETSCEHNNTLLDRGLLFGTPDGPGLGRGLFNRILETILS